MITITIEVDPRIGLAFAHVAFRLWPVIGKGRSWRLGHWGALRFARWRVNGGAWRFDLGSAPRGYPNDGSATRQRGQA